MEDIPTNPETRPMNGLPSSEPDMTPIPSRSWLSTNLRNIIALSLTVMICYLAYIGEQTAQAALVAAFSVLVGAIWGERAALKIAGKDK